MIIYYLTATQMQMIVEAGINPAAITKEGFINIFTTSDLCKIREKTNYLQTDGLILNQLGFKRCDGNNDIPWLHCMRERYGVITSEDLLVGAVCPSSDILVVWEITSPAIKESIDTQGTSDVAGVVRDQHGGRINADELNSNSLNRLMGVDVTSDNWVKGGYGGFGKKNTVSSNLTAVATNNMGNGKRNVLAILQALSQVITYDDLLVTQQFEISI